MTVGDRGFTVAEALVALLLTGLLLVGAWTMAARQRAAVVSLTEHSELIEAETVVWGVLREELARGRVGRDWTVERPGVVSLRAFRGIGLACGRDHGPPDELLVRYRGWRAPSAAKDSLVVLDRAGRWTVVDLVRVEPGSCGSGAPTLPAGDGGPGTHDARWHLRPAPDARPVLLRLFEHGSYHLEDGALRYRRGRGGRQPLTGPAVDAASRALWAGGPGALWLRFRPRPRGRAVGRREWSDTGWVRRLPPGGMP